MSERNSPDDLRWRCWKCGKEAVHYVKPVNYGDGPEKSHWETLGSFQGKRIQGFERPRRCEICDWPLATVEIEREDLDKLLAAATRGQRLEALRLAVQAALDEVNSTTIPATVVHETSATSMQLGVR